MLDMEQEVLESIAAWSISLYRCSTVENLKSPTQEFLLLAKIK
jgi:hypothetical protein